MENIKPREISIQQTGLRAYSVKVKLLDEETINQKTIDKTINGFVDFTMKQLKNQKLIPVDAEATYVKTSYLQESEVAISVQWNSSPTELYIVCDTLDTVITVAKQLNPVSHIIGKQSLAVYKDPMHKKYSVCIDMPTDEVHLKPIEAFLIHVSDYNGIHVRDSVNYPSEYWAEHGELICKDLFLLASI